MSAWARLRLRYEGLRKHPVSRAVLYVAKLALTVYILYMVLRRIDGRGLWASICGLPLWTLPLLLLGSVFRHWVQLCNWRYSLQLNPAYQMNRRDVWRSYFIGLPLRFAIPGGHASLGKIFWVDNTSHTASIMAFVAERGFLTWATWSFASGAALFHYQSVALWLRLVIFVLCVSLPLLAYYVMRMNGKSREALPLYRRLAPRMAGMQILASLVAFSQYWIILNTHQAISWLQSWKLMALTNFSNSIPITLAGLGLRESFAVYFLDTAGFSATQAVSSTLGLFIIQDALPALVGLVIFVRGKREGKRQHSGTHSLDKR
ncbi:MAG: hypothetical protein GX122_04070 [Candidatus Cloacimonetes bacterium]|nr:hypothetical protein [Candidatus Cloacimonadota bacterium]